MAESDELPPELSELEQQLRARRVPAGGEVYKQRVLQAVMNERRATERPSARLKRAASAWTFAAAIAAAVLLWLNLSLIAVSDTQLRAGAGGSSDERREAVQQLLEAVPELSIEDAQRQVLLFEAGARGIRAPVPKRSSTSL
ncbi:MAG TPA: hypothetical protein VEK08_03490 [Planctomycetota bacterium]|nr:hypothetical protein [Planctomycetota bacterium]